MQKTLFALLLSLFAVGANAQDAQRPQIIPQPAEMTVGTEVYTGSDETPIFKHLPALGKEGYTLEVTKDSIIVGYGDDAGKFYALKTLGQIKNTCCGIPCVKIKDAPRFPHRGLMIDVARHYWKPADIKRFIDLMSEYKFNKLHFHLTDDQGWRFPVTGYPLIDSISAFRAESFGDGKPHGGIYTKAELKDLVAYASKHCVEMIPEVDMPGHSVSLITAYPELTCFPDTNLKVRTTSGVTKELMCAANPEVWRFYKALFTDLAEIFPSPMVHLGGDEAPTDHWKKCPKCTELRKKEGLKNTHEQLEWFFSKAAAMLPEHGKKPLFWFEHEVSGYPKDATVYTWRMGLTPKTINAARERNLPIILAPGEHCYLDYPPSAEVKKTNKEYGWMPITTLEKTFKFNPDYGLPPEKRKHIIGVEGTLWGEAIPDFKQAVKMAFPRAFALSEAGWCQPETRSNWDDFRAKLEKHQDIVGN